jgi:hypothetical protein
VTATLANTPKSTPVGLAQSALMCVPLMLGMRAARRDPDCKSQGVAVQGRSWSSKENRALTSAAAKSCYNTAASGVRSRGDCAWPNLPQVYGAYLIVHGPTWKRACGRLQMDITCVGVFPCLHCVKIRGAKVGWNVVATLRLGGTCLYSEEAPLAWTLQGVAAHGLLRKAARLARVCYITSI